MSPCPKPFRVQVFAHPLPFNVIPHIDKFLDDQYTKEERKARILAHVLRRNLNVT